MKTEQRITLNLEEIESAIRKFANVSETAKVRILLCKRWVSDYDGKVLDKLDDDIDYRHAYQETYVSGAEIMEDFR